VPTLLLAFFSRGFDRSLFLEFASHGTGAGGIFLCIVPASFETIEHLLSPENLALCLLKL
jgi:hypothetical protein